MMPGSAIKVDPTTVKAWASKQADLAMIETVLERRKRTDERLPEYLREALSDYISLIK